MAFEKRGLITISSVRVFLLKSTNTLGSSPVQSLNNHNRFDIGRGFRLLLVKKRLYIFKFKKRDALNFCVISSPIVSTGTQRIICTRNTGNSQMTSSLSQICVSCSTSTMSSFPLEIKKNIQAIKIPRFLQSW